MNNFARRLFRPVFAAIVLAGCTTPQERQAANEAYLDRLFNREPLAVRQAYADSHPDLTPEERHDALSGLWPTGVVETNRLRRIKRAQEEAQRQKEIQKVEAALSAERALKDQTRQEYCKRTDVPEPIRNAIRDRHVLIGMTTEQVKLAWNEPREISIESNAVVTIEVWNYWGSTFLTFVNGRLDSFKEIKARN